jgi:hypothetical protein
MVVGKRGCYRTQREFVTLNVIVGVLPDALLHYRLRVAGGILGVKVS